MALTISDAIATLTAAAAASPLSGETVLVLSLSDSGLDVVNVDELALVRDHAGAVVEVRATHPALRVA